MFFLLIAFIFLPCLLSASDTNELSLDKESLEQEIQALKKNYEQLDKTMSGQDGNAREHYAKLLKELSEVQKTKEEQLAAINARLEAQRSSQPTATIQPNNDSGEPAISMLELISTVNTLTQKEGSLRNKLAGLEEQKAELISLNAQKTDLENKQKDLNIDRGLTSDEKKQQYRWLNEQINAVSSKINQLPISDATLLTKSITTVKKELKQVQEELIAKEKNVLGIPPTVPSNNINNHAANELTKQLTQKRIARNIGTASGIILPSTTTVLTGAATYAAGRHYFKKSNAARLARRQLDRKVLVGAQLRKSKLSAF
jgi:DNA repair exonuclease SbcCD ATPase subunit